MEKLYVSAIDKFMSDWGKAKGKENIVVFECDDKDEVKIVIDNIRNREDFKFVLYHNTYYPTFDEKKFYQEKKGKTDYPKFYEEGYFNY